MNVNELHRWSVELVYFLFSLHHFCVSELTDYPFCVILHLHTVLRHLHGVTYFKLIPDTVKWYVICITLLICVLRFN